VPCDIEPEADLTDAQFLNLVEQRFRNMFNFCPDINNQSYIDIEFVSNFQAITAGVRNTFGYIREGNDEMTGQVQKPQPIARPNGLVSTSPPLTNGHCKLTFHDPKFTKLTVINHFLSLYLRFRRIQPTQI
jgi:hypothetical protein